MVTPKNNLPPESQQWRRDMERRLAKLETSANNLQTAYKSSDTRLGSLVGSVKTLGDTVTTLDSTVTALDSTVTTLNKTTAQLSNQIRFSSSDVSYFNETLTTSVSGELPFDSNYDQSVTIAVPAGYPGGSVNATVWYGSSLAFTKNAGPSSTFFGNIQVYLEQTDGSGTTQVYWDALDLASFSYSNSFQRKSSPPITVSLWAGSTYTFRTRRQRDYTRISSSSFDTEYQTYPIVVLLQFVQGA